MGQHDLSYRLLFSDLHRVQDLLRETVGERWVELLDFDSGELVNTAFFKGFKSERDVLWKFWRKDGGDPIYLYIFLELQRPDRSMPIRLMACVGAVYQALLDSQPADARTKLPLVLPIVLNTSGKRWNVVTDLGSLIGDLDPSAEIYRPQLRYYVIDEAEVDQRLRGIQETIPAMDSLDEVETMLAENIDRWNRELREEGRQEGEARLVLRQLRLKFGPLDPEIEKRVRSADPERVLEWGERVLTAENLQDVFRD